METLASLTRRLVRTGWLVRGNMAAPIKYVYVDIVDFTKNRSVEAQCEIVGKLNAFFKRAMELEYGSRDEYIFIPTGDGICLALREGRSWDYDAPMKIALSLLECIHNHNASVFVEMRKFAVRIGINENLDNLITDINGKPNVAGLGVNMAQRIMSSADGNQILVGPNVYERLRGREKYMQLFREFQVAVKHDEQIRVYQYINEQAKGLNNDIPKSFAPAVAPQPKLTTLAGHYLSHAIGNEDFLYSRRNDAAAEHASATLLYLMALDSIAATEAGAFGTVALRNTWGGPDVPFAERYAHYQGIDSIVIIELASLISRVHLRPYQDCFERATYGASFVFVNAKGKEKLKQEWPDLCPQTE
jgi:class 3 adenylate cyclase